MDQNEFALLRLEVDSQPYNTVMVSRHAVIAALDMLGALRERAELLEAQRKQHRAKHKSYKRRFRIAPYRVQEWLIQEHDVLASVQQIEEAMNTPLADEAGLPGRESPELSMSMFATRADYEAALQQGKE